MEELESLLLAGQDPKDPKRAVYALRRAFSLAPEDGRVRAMLADALRRRARERLAEKDFDGADALVREALAAAPADAATGALAEEARVLREQTHSHAAALRERAAEPGRRRTSELIDRIRAAGRVYDLGKRRAATRRALAAALKADPSCARARLAAGWILFESGAEGAGRRLLSAALGLDQGSLGGGDVFAALLKLERWKEAVSAAERVLDAGPTLEDMRVFWNPWGSDERGSSRARALALDRWERACGRGSPWVNFYRGAHKGYSGLADYAAAARAPAGRYGWMLMKAGRDAFAAGSFALGEKWLRRSLRHPATDWRARGYLAEGLLCMGRSKDALAEAAGALDAAPERERRDALAWRGGIELWLGRYEAALKTLEEACRLGATFAFCWRGGALVKLGRYAEAAARLDETIELFPQDFEAYVWRAEARRALGRHADALKDLRVRAYEGGGEKAWSWGLVNRALTKDALGDAAGFRKDYAGLAPDVLGYVRRESGESEPRAVLRAALDLARGFRRDDYRQAIWMRRGRK